MTLPPEPPGLRTRPTVRPAVTIDGAPLDLLTAPRLARAVVDLDLHLPGMVELTFSDGRGDTLDLAGISIGSIITVTGAGTDDGVRSVAALITAEVTAIECVSEGMATNTVVRGYTQEHRMQRAHSSRTFLNSTDSDIASELAKAAGLKTSGVVATSTTYEYVAQVNQTDWDFLRGRATEIGYEIGVVAGVFHFRPATTVASPATTAPEPVTFPDDLVSFRPRVTAGNITPDVEVRIWDPLEVKAFAQVTATPSGGPETPATLGGQFTGAGAKGSDAGEDGGLDRMVDSATERLSDLSSLHNAMDDPTSFLMETVAQGVAFNPSALGPPPSPTAHVVVDRPFANGTEIATSGPAVAAGLGSDLGSTFAEAEGEAIGDPTILAGSVLEVGGVPARFAGQWLVSRSRHVFDDRESGYRTLFWAHGHQDRTVLGLTAQQPPEQRPLIHGVVCGVVSNNLDPEGKARVKVALPWLSPTFETHWAPSVQFVAGARSGALFLPEVGDEVMVAFEFGDPRRPYVLGGLINNQTTWKLVAPQVLAGTPGEGAGGLGGGVGAGGPMGMGGKVAMSAAEGAVEGGMAAASQSPGMVGDIVGRGFVSTTGNCLLFNDEALPEAQDALGTMTESEDVAIAAGAAEGAASGAMEGATGSSGIGGGPQPASGPAVGALASAVALGTQNGAIALVMDQVQAAASLTCNPSIGCSHSPLPQLTLAAQDGMVRISAGPAGTVDIDGGTVLNLHATAALNLTAPVINVNGVPLP